MELPSLAARPKRRGRPPKSGSTHSDTKERLVRAGVAILTEKGFAAVGLEEILSSVNIPKGSFYHYFSSKDEFGIILIDAYAAYFSAKLDHWLTDETQPPLQRLRDFIEDAKAGMARHGFRRGCLVGNLGQEMGVLPERFRDRLRGVFLDWQQRTARCLAAAQAAGEIAPDEDSDKLAAFFWIGWEGAVLRAKLERSADALDVFAQGFFAALRPLSSPVSHSHGASRCSKPF